MSYHTSFRSKACSFYFNLPESQISWPSVDKLRSFRAEVSCDSGMEYLCEPYPQVFSLRITLHLLALQPSIGNFELLPESELVSSSFPSDQKPHRSPKHLHLSIHLQELHLFQSVRIKPHRIYQDSGQLLYIFWWCQFILWSSLYLEALFVRI